MCTPLSSTNFSKGCEIVKVVYLICRGSDVHKRFFVLTLIQSGDITPYYQKKRFSTFNNQILAFIAELLENNYPNVAWNLQESIGFRYSILA
jgi:hypothetical protein